MQANILKPSFLERYHKRKEESFPPVYRTRASNRDEDLF
jgi:hypothetical protein